MRLLTEWLITLGLWLGRALSRLPRALRRPLAWGLGRLLFYLAGTRRRVAMTNLSLCCPSWSADQRRQVTKDHFVCYARAFFDRFEVWRADEQTVRRLVSVRHAHYFEAVKDRPTIVLAPHFLGLDAGGIRLQLDCRMVSMYSNQSSDVLNNFVLAGRSRFNEPVLLSRQDGIGRLVRLLKKGHTAYFLPDMDFGSRDAVFATFFNQPAATVTSVVRLAQLTGAAVCPMVTRMTDDGYEAQFYPAWFHSPDQDLQAAVQQMNDFIEQRVLEMPSQYLWTHRRFKTRPDGQASVYA
ncbi:lipid A biosynthesis acyltransferase [Betaproteobacteria bacterium LSUCC0115]|nr:lipid A biosynthesis acyltransferase [Burkholderiales bacterium LSUCC0115]